MAGAQLDDSPRSLTLEFSEGVHLIEGGLQLLNGDGEEVPLGPAQAVGRSVVIAVPQPLAEDGYVFTWRVLSADSHPLSGSVPFTVGDAPAAAVTEIPQLQSRAAEKALVVARWFAFLGLVLMLGPLLFVVLCWSGGATDRHTPRLVVAGAAAVLGGSVVGFLAQGPYVAGVSLGRFADTALLISTRGTTYGQAALVRVIAVLGLLLLLDILRSRRSVLALGGACAAAVALVVSYPVQGHAIAVSPRMLALASDSLHLVAVTTWMGGLAVLAVLLLRRGRPIADLADVLPRWSRVAAASIVLLTVTGAYQSLREVGSLSALTGTSYGKILLVKLTLFVTMLAMGNAARLWVRRRYPTTVVHAYSHESTDTAAETDPVDNDPDVRDLRRPVVAEAALGLVVLAVTAVLVATTPGRVDLAGSRQAAAASESPGATIGLPNGSKVVVDVGPSRVVTLALLDANGRPFDPQRVTANAASPAQDIAKSPLPLARTGSGRYEAAESPLPFPGEWLVTFTVRTSELQSSVGTATLDVP